MESDHLEDLGVDGSISSIKMVLQEVGWGSIDWMAMTQDMGRCPALVNAVMNLRFP
jgi:hypothetical protein